MQFNKYIHTSCVTPAGTSNELDVQNGWEENTQTHTYILVHTYMRLGTHSTQLHYYLLLLFPHISPISRTRGHRRRLPFPYHRYIQKTQTKEEKERKKNNRRENLPRSDRRGREKIKQEQKNKSKDPPRISERQIDKQARQTKCQDHTNCRYRTRVAKHTPPVAGRGAADSQALRQGAPV